MTEKPQLPYKVGDYISYTTGTGHYVTMQVVEIIEPDDADG